MNSNKRVYRAHIHERFSPEDGISVFCHYGTMSPCGEWVESGDVRWRRTPEWCDSEAEAKAMLAGRIAEIGARLLRQSSEILQAARAGEVVA